ncbi:hypothetical protein ACFQL1_21020 [Halomicroarcula sp. GCM10025709]
MPLTVGPTMLWIAAIIVYPTLKLLWSSVFWTNPINGQREFVALRNFRRLVFAENGQGAFLGLAPDFVAITTNTAVYVGLSVSISFALGSGSHSCSIKT